MYDIAISNLGWKKDEDIPVFELMDKSGIGCLEFCPFRDSDDLSSAKEMIDGLDKYKLKVVAMQALLYRYSDLVLFKDDETRMKLFEHMIKLIDFASDVGTKDIVFGCPKCKLRGDMELDKAFDIVTGFFGDIARHANTNDVTFCLEPTPEIYNADFILNTKEAIKLVEAVNDNAFKINLDIGACIHNDEDIVDIILSNTDLIGHVHISEPSLKAIIPDKETHTNIANALQDSGFSGSVSVEMLPSDSNNLSGLEKVISFTKEVYGYPKA